MTQKSTPFKMYKVEQTALLSLISQTSWKLNQKKESMSLYFLMKLEFNRSDDTAWLEWKRWDLEEQNIAVLA